jgi:ribosome-associated protein
MAPGSCANRAPASKIAGGSKKRMGITIIATAVYHEGKESSLSQTANPQNISPWLIAVRAAESKKALNIRVLDLRDVTSFTDYFVICTGSNTRQIQAIADEIGKQLDDAGERPHSIEGFQNAEWVLIDYGDYIVHIFAEEARKFYDLERLWRHAKDVAFSAA